MHSLSEKIISFPLLRYSSTKRNRNVVKLVKEGFDIGWFVIVDACHCYFILFAFIILYFP